jgi:hypothetical protein
MSKETQLRRRTFQKSGSRLFLTLSLRLAFKLLNPFCRAILRALKKNLKVLHFLSQYYKIFSHYHRWFAVSRAHKIHVFGV